MRGAAGGTGAPTWRRDGAGRGDAADGGAAHGDAADDCRRAAIVLERRRRLRATCRDRAEPEFARFVRAMARTKRRWTDRGPKD